MTVPPGWTEFADVDEPCVHGHPQLEVTSRGRHPIMAPDECFELKGHGIDKQERGRGRGEEDEDAIASILVIALLPRDACASKGSIRVESGRGLPGGIAGCRQSAPGLRKNNDINSCHSVERS